ncbi:DUF6708 domain-containing protein [Pseudomonas fontis]|uniref:DUF6708 domain-containing protein n=1 Tax=Pseudomonas fontis TaxID=2942633 RepID=A0ABT5NXI8_9PSED|nr:DUF6708 domain-containing protein [Pseudomonas fontis]MDD0974091.1 hypothetical protein [Pseudomonas fontis]MDD0992824.1 hypothetical protein [Pseudomonas fontis]
MSYQEFPLPPKPLGWKYNLPAPNQNTSSRADSTSIHPPPNKLNNIYIEFHYASLLARGVLIYLGAMIAIAALAFAIFCICLSITFPESRPIAPALGLLITTVSIIYGAAPMIRLDLTLPRDEPIRFNRLRRKVYVYRFHHSWLKPLSRRAWGVRPVAYNWDDLRAEAWMIYAPMGTGGLKEGITLAVIKPGTDEVIDRFNFTEGILKGEMYWALVQQFMQQGPQALPTFRRPPRDWNNDPATLNLARRWAPKVQWPVDMDLESRTAPEHPPG